MAQQLAVNVENNFTSGLKTEFTGLNFPENAATDTDNCIYTLTGEVIRRPGIDCETNFHNENIFASNKAISDYVWNNAGGDGLTQIYVLQIGRYLYFYKTSDATAASPMSNHKLASVIDLATYNAGLGVAAIETTECQFADGNGFLFVFNTNMNSIYCTFVDPTVTATAIILQIRDFTGVVDQLDLNERPTSLSDQHNYNLRNQGWSASAAWSASSSTSVSCTVGSRVFTIAAGLPIVNGTPVQCSGLASAVGSPAVYLYGTVTSYVGTTLTINVTNLGGFSGALGDTWTILPTNVGLLNTWFGAEGNYPSNSDIWWRFRNSSGVFDPATTVPNVTYRGGLSRNGYYIFEPFNQNRSVVSGLPNLTSISTPKRASTGAWFQGRVWYSGIDAFQASTGNADHYSWSENIYFSQVIENAFQFGYCYQNNDPTDEEFFDLLPTDGGVIRIQGCGTIFKLFPIQNGLLVHASNGIWFITGSQGIGFSANDYTITKISSVRCLSASSFVDVLGFPVFWNDEGIYEVSLSPQGGGLVVNNLCIGTILSFYNEIPSVSKRYAKGTYDPISFVFNWVYRDTKEADISNRYKYNRILNFNTANKAFYPDTIGNVNSAVFVSGVKYIANPNSSSTSLEPTVKYLITDSGTNTVAFGEKFDETNWVDFHSKSGGVNYTSYFVTGYKLHGQGVRKFQPVYLQMFSRADEPTAYKIQGIWDYANDRNSGRYSAIQVITNSAYRYGFIYRRHRIRGRGIALQLKVISVDGMPFNIIGWSSLESQSSGM